MNSIFDNNLLEALIKIGQAKVAPTNLDQLKNVALRLIDDLKQNNSSVKANSNPSFSDLKSLRAFSEWLKSSGATYAKKPIVDGVGHNGPDHEGLQAILLDLRKKAAGTKGLYSEAIANLISQFNKVSGGKIAMYEPAETNPESNSVQPKEKNTILDVKLDQSAVDGVNGAPATTGQPVASPAGVASAVSSLASLSLLDGMNIDFDDVYENATHIRNLVNRIPGAGKHYAQLERIINIISNTVRSFKNITSEKTPGITGIMSAAPSISVAELRDNIRLTFSRGVVQNDKTKPVAAGAYTAGDLSKICNAFAALMSEVDNFYSVLLLIPEIGREPQTKPILEKQMEWAKLYQQRFIDTAFQFNELYKNVPGYAGP